MSPRAVNVPEIDSYIGLMHTLFTIEDLYGLKINRIDGELCLTLDKSTGVNYVNMFDMLNAWHKEAEKLKSGEITKEEYDKWRYHYPEFDTSGHWRKVVPSQGLSDMLVDTFKEEKND